MKWTQDSINEWALATFGESSPQHMLARAIQEASELLMEVTKIDMHPEKISEECADIIGPLCRVSAWAGCDITPVFSVCDFISTGNLYSPAVRVTQTLVYLMERMSPQNIIEKRTVEKLIGGIVIDLAEISASVGVKLGDAINAKMEILLTRKWKLDGNGAGQHVSCNHDWQLSRDSNLIDRCIKCGEERA